MAEQLKGQSKMVFMDNKLQNFFEHVVLVILVLEFSLFIILNLPLFRGLKPRIIKFLIATQDYYYIRVVQYGLLAMSLGLLYYSYNQEQNYKLIKQEIRNSASAHKTYNLRLVERMISRAQCDIYIYFMNAFMFFVVWRMIAFLQHYYEVKSKVESLPKSDSEKKND